MAIWEENFESNANSILKEFYTKEYANHDSGSIVKRQVHGVMHAARTAIHVENLNGILIGENPEIQESLNGLSREWGMTTDGLLRLTQYTALLHDAGREGEGPDKWDVQSSIILNDYLVSKGVAKNICNYFSAMIKFKDNPTEFKELIEKTDSGKSYLSQGLIYLHQLVHDADCLDVIRTRSIFDPMRLYCYREIGDQLKEKIIGYAKVVGTKIEEQNDALCRCKLMCPKNQILVTKKTISDKHKVKLEHHSKPYTAMLSAMSSKAQPKQNDTNLAYTFQKVLPYLISCIPVVIAFFYAPITTIMILIVAMSAYSYLNKTKYFSESCVNRESNIAASSSDFLKKEQYIFKSRIFSVAQRYISSQSSRMGLSWTKK